MFPVMSYTQQQRCHCGHAIQFDDIRCRQCDIPVGFDPDKGHLISLKVADIDERWVSYQEEHQSSVYQTWQRCANLESPIQCNWLVSGLQDQHSHGDLCLACALNIATPNPNGEQEELWWRECEKAKRRLIAQLLALGLPVETREQNPRQGLAFELRRAGPNDPPATLGYNDGVITFDIIEADQDYRENMRLRLRGPRRTLLGHLRHESGHYYWQRFVNNSHWLPAFRELFGDEQLNYQQAMQQHYSSGPPSGWQETHFCSHAAAHPWEDWTETWAQVLHITSGLGVAARLGIDIEGLNVPASLLSMASLSDCSFYEPVSAAAFLAEVNRWFTLSRALNRLSQSTGQDDGYPPELSRVLLQKLYLVATVIEHGNPESDVNTIGPATSEDY